MLYLSQKFGQDNSNSHGIENAMDTETVNLFSKRVRTGLLHHATLEALTGCFGAASQRESNRRFHVQG